MKESISRSFATAVAAFVAVCAAGPATADPSSTLNTAVVALRVSSKCHALRSDPTIARAAHMAIQATSDYVAHRSAAVPFTDPLPALQTLGYTGSKALLFSGYGKDETDAIHGLLLEGRTTIPDCSYSEYGTDAVQDGESVLTSLILAAP